MADRKTATLMLRLSPAIKHDLREWATREHWIMERYAVTTDKASGIKNDPNAWSDDSRYIVDLIKRIVQVSLESVRLVVSLPALQEAK